MMRRCIFLTCFVVILTLSLTKAFADYNSETLNARKVAGTIIKLVDLFKWDTPNDVVLCAVGFDKTVIFLEKEAKSLKKLSFIRNVPIHKLENSRSRECDMLYIGKNILRNLVDLPVLLRNLNRETLTITSAGEFKKLDIMTFILIKQLDNSAKSNISLSFQKELILSSNINVTDYLLRFMDQ